MLATTPPVNNDAFSGQSNYHSTLLVPVGCWEAYAHDDSYWYKFINIKENANTTEELNAAKAYMLKNADTRSYLAYDPVNDEVTEIELDANVNEDEPNHNWQIIEKEGQTYIYNLGAKKYLVRQSAAMSPALRSMAAVAAPADNWGLSEYPTPISMENCDQGINIGQSGAWLFVLNDQLNVDKNVSGIEQLSISNSDAAPAYDFFGRKLKNTPKGNVFVQQGKKMLLK